MINGVDGGVMWGPKALVCFFRRAESWSMFTIYIYIDEGNQMDVLTDHVYKTICNDAPCL